MNRRQFSLYAAGGAAAASSPWLANANAASPQTGDRKIAARGEPFKLKYAPHFGMFKNHAESMEDQLTFAADEGFRAWEDNGMKGRSPEVQKALAKRMQELDIEMGVFVAHADFGKATFAAGDKKHRQTVLDDIKASLDVAQTVNAKWCTVVPGILHHRLAIEYQTQNVIDLLRECADVCETAGLTMVLEPLNFRDHPNLFLQRVPQAYQVCRGVGSDSCKILDDLYHQQIAEGNLIPNLDRAWSEIAYIQVGDNPGRREPTTGEINYLNVFKHLHKKGFDGIVGMEHGNSQGGKEGERAVIDAYRAVDAFE